MKQGEYEMRVRRQESFLLAQAGQFLGILSSNRYQADSVMNEYGSYGSKYSSTSIFNPYCLYGGRYASYSPFNPLTSTPPKIILRGREIAFLTTNTYIQNRLNPYQLFDWIRGNRL